MAAPSQAHPARVTLSGKEKALPDWEADYLVLAVDRLYANCARVENLPAGSVPAARNQLSVSYADQPLRVIQALGGGTSPFSKLAIYSTDSVSVKRYHDCNPAHVLPVASIIESQNLDVARPERRTTARLTSYEPNKVGWTYDDNDVNEGYLDALLSVKYPFLHDGYYSEESSFFSPFFAFSGRFSQYIESRNSSPGIGKRFNPKLFFRHWMGNENNYLDIG